MRNFTGETSPPRRRCGEEREREENTKRKEPLTPSYINNELRRLIIKIGIVIVERNDRLIEFYFFFSSPRRHVFKFHRGLEKAFEPIIDRRKKNPPWPRWCLLSFMKCLSTSNYTEFHGKFLPKLTMTLFPSFLFLSVEFLRFEFRFWLMTDRQHVSNHVPFSSSLSSNLSICLFPSTSLVV